MLRYSKKPIVTLFLATALWGMHGIPMVLANAEVGVTALSRFLVSIIVMVIWITIRKDYKQFSLLLRPSPRQLVCALFWAFTGLFFVSAVILSGGEVASVTVIGFSYSLYLTLIRFISGRQVNTLEWQSAIITVLGVSLFLSSWQLPSLWPGLLALASGVSFALYLFTVDGVKEKSHVENSVVLGQMMGLVVILAASLFGFLNIDLSFSVQNTFWLVSLGTITGVTYLIYASVASQVASTVSSKILMCEIIFAAIFSFCVLGEQMTISMLIGTVIIVSGILWQLHESPTETITNPIWVVE